MRQSETPGLELLNHRWVVMSAVINHILRLSGLEDPVASSSQIPEFVVDDSNWCFSAAELVEIITARASVVSILQLSDHRIEIQFFAEQSVELGRISEKLRHHK